MLRRGDQAEADTEQHVSPVIPATALAIPGHLPCAPDPRAARRRVTRRKEARGNAGLWRWAAKVEEEEEEGFSSQEAPPSPGWGWGSSKGGASPPPHPEGAGSQSRVVGQGGREGAGQPSLSLGEPGNPKAHHGGLEAARPA